MALGPVSIWPDSPSLGFTVLAPIPLCVYKGPVAHAFPDPLLPAVPPTLQQPHSTSSVLRQSWAPGPRESSNLALPLEPSCRPFCLPSPAPACAWRVPSARPFPGAAHRWGTSQAFVFLNNPRRDSLQDKALSPLLHVFSDGGFPEGLTGSVHTHRLHSQGCPNSQVWPRVQLCLACDLALSGLSVLVWKMG